jgi:hypothetical protein
LGIIKKIPVVSVASFALFLQSCFFIKKAVPITSDPIKDTVDVYHFVITYDKAKPADTSLIGTYTRESKTAYDWITKQAKLNGQNLNFREHWPLNKDTALKRTFVFRLPSNSLTILSMDKHSFKKWVNDRTENESKREALKNWEQNLFMSIAKSVRDSMVKKMIYDSYQSKKSNVKSNSLFVVHFMKVKKKDKILGFYNNRNAVFIGRNKSRTISHESIHYLGAPDLYIHKYWFGKRRRIVKRYLDYDIMNTGPSDNSNHSEISNYTAYTIGWTKTLDKRFKPILKQNKMARFLFNFSLKL